MTCSELTDFLLDYVAHELPAAQRTAFEAHLGVCPDCRKYLDSYRKTVELSKSSLRAPAVPVEKIPESLVAAIMHAKRKPSAR